MRRKYSELLNRRIKAMNGKRNAAKYTAAIIHAAAYAVLLPPFFILILLNAADQRLLRIKSVIFVYRCRRVLPP